MTNRTAKKGRLWCSRCVVIDVNYHFSLLEEPVTRGVAYLNTYVQADTFLRRPAMR